MAAGDHLQRIISFLRSIGATSIRCESRSKHQKIVWDWQGQEASYLTACTVSDHRATQNAIHDIRNQLGLTKREKTVGERRERKPSRVQGRMLIDALGTFMDFHDWRVAQARGEGIPGLPLVVECLRRGRLIATHYSTDAIAPRDIIRELGLSRTLTVRTYREGRPDRVHVIQRELSVPY